MLEYVDAPVIYLMGYCRKFQSEIQNYFNQRTCIIDLDNDKITMPKENEDLPKFPAHFEKNIKKYIPSDEIGLLNL